VPDEGEHKKFIFNGDNIYLNINLGRMAFINKIGANEIYEAYRIELHFPSEHFITLNNQTPRYPIEMQIYHNIVISDNSKVTNQTIKVNKAVVSIMFTVGTLDEGDIFLNQFGISSRNKINIDYNVNSFNALNKFKKDTYIEQKKFIVGTYASGFSIKALQGLLNILNADQHIYIYYGSETLPPCREEALWIVFARPRSISEGQMNFLKNQLTRNVKPKVPVTKALTKKELYGNNRSIQVR
jgi:carbonic anhydrase